jgi:hypothetical protein
MNYIDHFLYFHLSFLPFKAQVRNEEYLTSFQGLLKRILFLNCEIEIIGNWIYCFGAETIGAYLLKLGFWFSSKHGAWIYNGAEKEFNANDETLNEIRERIGSQRISKRVIR